MGGARKLVQEPWSRKLRARPERLISRFLARFASSELAPGTEGPRGRRTLVPPSDSHAAPPLLQRKARAHAIPLLGLRARPPLPPLPRLCLCLDCVTPEGCLQKFESTAMVAEFSVSMMVWTSCIIASLCLSSLFWFFAAS